MVFDKQTNVKKITLALNTSTKYTLFFKIFAKILFIIKNICYTVIYNLDICSVSIMHYLRCSEYLINCACNLVGYSIFKKVSLLVKKKERYLFNIFTLQVWKEECVSLLFLFSQQKGSSEFSDSKSWCPNHKLWPIKCIIEYLVLNPFRVSSSLYKHNSSEISFILLYLK